MRMYSLIEYSDNYSKTSGSLWQYYRDKTALANGAIVNFPANNNNSVLFIFKHKITGKPKADGKREVKIIVPLKYLSNCWRTLKI